MLVIRKNPAPSDVVVLTAAVPWLVSLTSAPVTTLPAGSTTIPRIELETLCAKPAIVPSANRTLNSASLRGCIRGTPLPGSKQYQKQFPNASAFSVDLHGIC